MLRPAASDIPEDRLALRPLGAVNRIFTRSYHTLDLIRPCQLPKTGPAILICNHISGLDPAFIQSATPRLIVWMMAKEYYDISGLGWFYRQIEAIPVSRSGRDMAAMRAAMRALHDNRIIGIFPEGRIETSRKLLPFQPGAAVLAMKAAVPIYPAYITGTQRKQEMALAISLPQRARLNFGDPYVLDDGDTAHEKLESAAIRMEKSVELLRNQTERMNAIDENGDAGSIPA